MRKKRKTMKCPRRREKFAAVKITWSGTGERWGLWRVYPSVRDAWIWTKVLLPGEEASSLWINGIGTETLDEVLLYTQSLGIKCEIVPFEPDWTLLETRGEFRRPRGDNPVPHLLSMI